MVIISNIVAKVFFETIKSRAFKEQRFEYIYIFFLTFFLGSVIIYGIQENSIIEVANPRVYLVNLIS